MNSMYITDKEKILYNVGRVVTLARYGKDKEVESVINEIRNSLRKKEYINTLVEPKEYIKTLAGVL